MEPDQQQQHLKDTVVTVSDRVKDDLSQGRLQDVLREFHFELEQIGSTQEEPEFTCDDGSVLQNNTCGEFMCDHGSVLQNNTCGEFTCDDGSVLQNNSCGEFTCDDGSVLQKTPLTSVTTIKSRF